MPDRVVGRYELRERLGSSATATVWRARDRRRQRDVALKVAAAGSTELSGRQLLEAEAAAAARLDHPNIVPVLDTHLGSGEAALAFQLIEGETLARRLARDGRLAPFEAARIATDVATALAHAHNRGVVHRDVKPANVLLGSDGRARLFDFGISATPERSGGELVEPGMTTGTLPYMAPEQLVGQPPDPATDVYALGVVLYEMLAGRRPYQAATTDELARLQPLPPPPIDAVPPRLAELTMLALHPDSMARPRAPALAARLRRLVSGAAEDETVALPLAATVMTPSPDVGRPSGSGRRVSVLTAVGMVLVLVAAVAGAAALGTALNRPADQATRTLPSVSPD